MSTLIPEEVLKQYALHPWTWESWVPEEILKKIPNDSLTKFQISVVPWWTTCEDAGDCPFWSLCSDSPPYSDVFFELAKIQETFTDALEEIPPPEEMCEGESDNKSDNIDICEVEPPIFIVVSEKKTLVVSSRPVEIIWSNKKQEAVNFLKFFFPTQPEGNKAA